MFLLTTFWGSGASGGCCPAAAGQQPECEVLSTECAWDWGAWVYVNLNTASVEIAGALGVRQRSARDPFPGAGCGGRGAECAPSCLNFTTPKVGLHGRDARGNLDRDGQATLVKPRLFAHELVDGLPFGGVGLGDVF